MNFSSQLPSLVTLQSHAADKISEWIVLLYLICASDHTEQNAEAYKCRTQVITSGLKQWTLLKIRHCTFYIKTFHKFLLLVHLYCKRAGWWFLCVVLAKTKEQSHRNKSVFFFIVLRIETKFIACLMIHIPFEVITSMTLGFYWVSDVEFQNFSLLGGSCWHKNWYC